MSYVAFPARRGEEPRMMIPQWRREELDRQDERYARLETIRPDLERIATSGPDGGAHDKAVAQLVCCALLADMEVRAPRGGEE